MKFKHLLLTASVMALFSSCSNDELVSETTNHGDAIAFSVTTNNATRAHDYWCNANLPDFFEVSAIYDGKTYFEGDVYTNSGSGSTYTPNDGNYRYWPDIYPAQGTVGSEGYVAGKSLNVYAYKVKDDASATGTGFATFKWNNGVPTIEMEPKTAAAEQHDLLYAYTQVFNKPTYGATAPINFRHALSQIVFYAKCENTKIYVEIEEIALMNAATSGTFTLPTGNNVTDANYTLHPSATGTVPATGLGTWALTYASVNNNRSYTASCVKALTSGGTEWENLTDNKTESDFTQSLLVLPHGKNTDNTDQKLAAYVPYTGTGDTKTYQPLSSVGGACIAIKCKIRNIAGTEVKDNDVYLWGDKQTDGSYKAKDLVVPVDFTWEQGKKYIYRINFSMLGHGGYNPEDGKEVLVPIQLSVTVDDFAAVADSEATVKDI